LQAAFAARAGETGLIPFLTAGYPSLAATLEMLRGFDRAGALAVELGIPFSDPIADGPDIQRASEWALRDHVGAADVLDLVAAFRRESDIPPDVLPMQEFSRLLAAFYKEANIEDLWKRAQPGTCTSRP